MAIERFDPLSRARTRTADQSHPIYWLGLQWAVTAEGLESRDGAVVIEAARLWEDEKGQDWTAQMQGLAWVDMADFNEALAFAQGLWPRVTPLLDGWGLTLIDAHMAWCPNSVPHHGNARRGRVVVGRKAAVTREAERGPTVDRLPLMRRVCAASGLQPRIQSERIALMFIAFNMLVVRDRLDPQAVHRAFLAIDEYRLCMPPELPDDAV